MATKKTTPKAAGAAKAAPPPPPAKKAARRKFVVNTNLADPEAQPSSLDRMESLESNVAQIIATLNRHGMQLVNDESEEEEPLDAYAEPDAVEGDA